MSIKKEKNGIITKYYLEVVGEKSKYLGKITKNKRGDKIFMFKRDWTKKQVWAYKNVGDVNLNYELVTLLLPKEKVSYTYYTYVNKDKNDNKIIRHYSIPLSQWVTHGTIEHNPIAPYDNQLRLRIALIRQFELGNSITTNIQ